MTVADRYFSSQPITRRRFDFLRLARGKHQATGGTRAGAHVDDMIGGADDFLVVFHHHHRVAKVAQAGEGADQAGGIGGMEADAGLVEHVDHAGEAGTELGGEADALGLAAG